MNVRQLHTSYVLKEDRVLLRLSTSAQQEYRLWLTRAMTGQCLVFLEQAAVQNEVRQGSGEQALAVARFKQQTLAENARFSTFEGAPHLPLGAQPVLVSGVRIDTLHQRPVLLLQLSASQQLRLPLGEDLAAKLRLLLQRMNEQAGWGLVSAAAPAQLSQPQDGVSRQVH
jgi:hypothetical protein